MVRPFRTRFRATSNPQVAGSNPAGVCKVTQFCAKYLVGHEDYELIAKVYQQVMDVSDHSLDLLEDLIGCSLDEAKPLLRRVRGGAQRATAATSAPETEVQLAA
jgi:hypothetical protein